MPIIIRKHVVRVDCRDYGSHLDTVYRLATSVDGCRPVTDGPEFRSLSVAITRRDAEVAAAQEGCPASVVIEVGEDCHRTCDMNPHGLI